VFIAGSLFGLIVGCVIGAAAMFLAVARYAARLPSRLPADRTGKLATVARGPRTVTIVVRVVMTFHGIRPRDPNNLAAIIADDLADETRLRTYYEDYTRAGYPVAEADAVVDFVSA
jgi:hypothetical protein